MRRTLFATIATATLTAATALAQTATPARTPKPAAAKAAADQTFVTKAARGGMAEVELGKLAADKGSSDEVKKFGQRMVDDHGRAGDELKTLAQSKNITLPTAIDSKDAALRDRLSKLSGDAFDRAYIQAMVADHRQDVSEFRVESRSGKDPDVKAWAMKTLPTLQAHLKQAEDANKAVGTAGRTPSK